VAPHKSLITFIDRHLVSVGWTFCFYIIIHTFVKEFHIS